MTSRGPIPPPSPRTTSARRGVSSSRPTDRLSVNDDPARQHLFRPSHYYTLNHSMYRVSPSRLRMVPPPAEAPPSPGGSAANPVSAASGGLIAESQRCLLLNNTLCNFGGIDREHPQMIFRVIHEAEASRPSNLELYLSQCRACDLPIREVLCRQLSYTPGCYNLVHLHCDGTFFGDAGLMSLATLISHNFDSLRSLRLRSCDVTNAGVVSLCTGLQPPLAALRRLPAVRVDAICESPHRPAALLQLLMPSTGGEDGSQGDSCIQADLERSLVLSPRDARAAISHTKISSPSERGPLPHRSAHQLNLVDLGCNAGITDASVPWLLALVLTSPSLHRVALQLTSVSKARQADITGSCRVSSERDRPKLQGGQRLTRARFDAAVDLFSSLMKRSSGMIELSDLEDRNPSIAANVRGRLVSRGHESSNLSVGGARDGAQVSSADAINFFVFLEATNPGLPPDTLRHDVMAMSEYVLVKPPARPSTEKLLLDQKIEVLRMFKAMDVDRDGRVSLKDMRQAACSALACESFVAICDKLGISSDEGVSAIDFSEVCAPYLVEQRRRRRFR